MWDSVLEKIAVLQEMDKQFQAFGAEMHRYERRPCVSESEIAAWESQWHCRLPEQLRSFYLTVGNGIVGPSYGLFPLQELGCVRPDMPFPGEDECCRLFETAPSYYGENETDGENDEWLILPPGVIAVIDTGCGHYLCLETTGEQPGRVIYASCDFPAGESQYTLVDLYHQWLDEEIPKFTLVRELIDTGAALSEIEKQFTRRFPHSIARNIVASMVNAHQPVESFTSDDFRITVGCIETSWYEHVLDEWQRKHL